MTEFEVRFAKIEDIPSIMKFIDAEWKKDHILARDRALFDWQYVNDDKVNMVIGESENHEILGVLGYIPYMNSDNKDLSLALWKAKDGTAFLGVKLLSFLMKEESYRTIFCNGINIATTAQIYKRFRFDVDKLKQWYRLCDLEEYQVAKVWDKCIPTIKRNSKIHLIQIEKLEILLEKASEKFFDVNAIPFKSPEYIQNRYFNHPVYKYLMYALKNEDELFDAAIVLRVQECNGSKILRIIDVLGDNKLLYDITNQLEEIADEFDAEYIDMYEFGLEDNVLADAGWLLVGADENIIPNYFSPYTQSNIEINISMQDQKIVMFKGDGDQDRPN